MSPDASAVEQGVRIALLEVLQEGFTEYLQRKLGDSLVRGGRARVSPGNAYIDVGMIVAVEARAGRERIGEAEVECGKRLEEGVADLCVAVAYDEGAGGAGSQQRAEGELRVREHRVRLVTPLGSEDLGDLSLEDLARALEERDFYETLLEWEAVEGVAEEIMEVLDGVSRLGEELREELAKAAEEALALRGEGAAAKAKLLLFTVSNALIFHEALARSMGRPRPPSLTNVDRGDPIGWLLKEWEGLGGESFSYVFEQGRRALSSLPRNDELNSLLLALAGKAAWAARGGVLRRDLAGRLYQKLLSREVAKGLATFYTSVPASVIVSSLALDLLDTDWGKVGELERLRVCDLSCGSGKLLSAVYSGVVSRYVRAAGSARVELDTLHRALVERVIYGIDVMDYAAHLAVASLVMRRPSAPVGSINIFVAPLGVVNGRPLLGSLSLLVAEGRAALPSFKAPGSAGVRPGEAPGAGAISTDLFDLVIMNPPFARSGNAGHSVLFGHVEGAQRREILGELMKLGNSMRRSLGLRGGFGRAGLAAYFTLLGYRVLKEGGVAALVLPRVFLSGSDWGAVREFLLSRGEVSHIVISDDPEANWAWSENSGLSEMLLVYRKGREAGGDVLVTYVRKFPSSSLKAELYARRIREAREELKPGGNGFSATEEVFVKGAGGTRVPVMYIYAIRGDVFRRAAEEAKNLNVALGFHHSLLSAAAFDLFFKREFLSSRAPLVPLKQYVERLYPGKDWERATGYDVRAFRDMCLKGNLPFWALRSLSRETMFSLTLRREVLEQINTNRRCAERAGRLVVPGIGRFGVNSVGAVAMTHESPLLSDVAWTVPLGPEDARLQTLWLNSTPGLVHFLSLRQDSSGPYIPLKKSSLGSLLLVDTKALAPASRERLLLFFESNAWRELGSVREQLREALEGRGFRRELDRLVLTELFGLEPERAERELPEVYRRLLGETII